MKLDLSPLTIDQFLSEYWQKKPLLIKNAFTDFVDPLSANELAGLASESNIESRIISKNKKSWQAESGPFSDYDQYGNDNWSLVVQSVNHWVKKSQTFVRFFDFIPQWRFDDLMVSFATSGGGVGPHVDNYDAFICQGSGKRHWKVGDKKPLKEVIAHEKLRHVAPFTPIIDEVVNAGDVLYIPPGYPHEGVSINISMSFSVGYKTTNATELLSGFADYLIDFDKKPALLSDSNRNKVAYGQIDQSDFERLHQFLQNTLANKEKLTDFIGIYYSQSLNELDLNQEEYHYDEWLATFETRPLNKLYAVKSLYLDKNIDQGFFYFDGERQQLSSHVEIIKKICNQAVISIQDIQKDQAVLKWLWQSTQRGYWYF